MLDAGHETSQEELERDLRAALTPLPAPQGFADRVMARLAAEDSRQAETSVHVLAAAPRSAAAPSAVPPGASRPVFGIRTPRRNTPWRNAPWLRSGIAAMLLMTVLLGGYLEHRRQERIAGEQARRQVLLALRIAGTTLVDVRNKTDRGYFHSNITQDEREP